MGWFDIIKNLSAEEQRKLLEDLNAPNTEKPPRPDMNAQTIRRAPDLGPVPPKRRPQPLETQMVDNKTRDLMSRLQRAAGDFNLVSTLEEYNRMPSKTDAQRAKKRAFAQTPEMRKITQASTQMKLGNYKKPTQEKYNKDGSKVSVARQQTLNAGKKVFGNRPIKGPPTRQESEQNKLSLHVRRLLDKKEAGKRVQSVVNPQVEERQSQKDQVAQRIAEERRKREETIARMREQRKPAGSVKDARRARIAASSSGGLPTSR